jgi:hypothetical protein
MLENLKGGIRQDVMPAFLEYLEKLSLFLSYAGRFPNLVLTQICYFLRSDGKDNMQSLEQHYSGADLSLKYQRFLEDSRTLA